MRQALSRSASFSAPPLFAVSCPALNSAARLADFENLCGASAEFASSLSASRVGTGAAAKDVIARSHRARNVRVRCGNEEIRMNRGREAVRTPPALSFVLFKFLMKAN